MYRTHKFTFSKLAISHWTRPPMKSPHWSETSSVLHAEFHFRRMWLVKTRRLPRYHDPRNLVRFRDLPHTRLTYHRTWETGLETEIRVAAFNPAFFCPLNPLLDAGPAQSTINTASALTQPDHSPTNVPPTPRIE